MPRSVLARVVAIQRQVAHRQDHHKLGETNQRTRGVKQRQRRSAARDKSKGETTLLREAASSEEDSVGGFGDEFGLDEDSDAMIQDILEDDGEEIATANSIYLANRDQLRRIIGLSHYTRRMQSEIAAAIIDSLTKLRALLEAHGNCPNATAAASFQELRIIEAMQRRTTVLERTQRDAAREKTRTILFLSLAHTYRKLQRHTLVNRAQLDEVSYAAQSAKLFLDSKAHNVWLTAFELVYGLLPLRGDAVAPSRHFSLSNPLHNYARLIACLHHHLYIVSRLYAEVKKCTRALKDLTMLENSGLGLTYSCMCLFTARFYDLLEPLSSIKAWTWRRWTPLLPSTARYAESLAASLAHIDERALHLLRDIASDIESEIARFRSHLLAKTGAINASGTLLQFTETIRRQLIDRRLDTYKAEYGKESYHFLWRCGYRPSNWLIRVCGQKVPSRRKALVQIRKDYASPLRLHYVHSELKMNKLRLPKIPLERSASRRADRRKPGKALDQLRRPLFSTPLCHDAQHQTNGTAKAAKASSSVLSTSRRSPHQGSAILTAGSSSEARGRTKQPGHIRKPGDRQRAETHFNARLQARTPTFNADSPFSLTAMSGFPITAKNSLLRRTCNILELRGAHYPGKRANTKPQNDRGRKRKVFSEPQVRPQDDTHSDRRLRDRVAKIGPNRTCPVRRVPVDETPHQLRFEPSPRMRAPQSTPFFAESSVSKQHSVDGCGGVNGPDRNDEAQDSGDSPSPVTNQGTTSDKGDDRPNSNPPNNEQRPPPPNSSMRESSDPEYPSESEHESDSEDELDTEEDAEEEHIPLSYQIPPDLLRAAMEASPNTQASYWSQRLYRGPHDEHLSTHYCKTIEVAERVAKYFLKEKVVGFDIEWKPFAFPNSIKENASLIQLACEDRIALFHIAQFSGRTAQQLVPPTLKTILESPDIYKVGVAVKADFTRLRNYLGIQARGVFELSRLYNLVQHQATDPSKVNFTLVSLARQVQQHLLLPLYKGETLADGTKDKEKGSVRESDWSQALDTDQVRYAAADAYAGFRLFDVLESKRKKLKPTPPLPRLCDQDPVREERPKTKKLKPKAAKKIKEDTAKVTAGALEEELEGAEEDTQEYETAPEEFADSDESEELESESSCSDDDPDADYVARRVGRLTIGRDAEGSTATSRTNTRRVGRIALSRVGVTDPGYPVLPPVSSENGSEESNALDAPAKTPLRRHESTPDISLPQVDVEMGEHEFSDPELEEALIAMDIEKPKEAEDVNVTGEQTEAETVLLPSEPIEQLSETEAMDLDTNSASARAEDTIQEQRDPSVDAFIPSETLQPSTPPTPTFKPLVLDTSSHTPEYLHASDWAQSYLHSTIPSASSPSSRPSRIRATMAHLRAYHLWHHQQLPLDDIGAHLRDPPLAQSTISSYILQAINLERLEYSDEKLRGVLMGLPPSVRLRRWGWLSRRVGITQ